MSYAIGLQTAFYTEEFGAECMDAPEFIPAGGCFGGDAPAYTGALRVAREGLFAKSEIDAFAALFA